MKTKLFFSKVCFALILFGTITANVFAVTDKDKDQTKTMRNTIALASMAAINLGADATTNGAAVDGWGSNLIINKTDIYTNTSGSGETITVNTFNFFALPTATNPVTPFVVKVNADNDFTVLAIGTTRTSSDYTISSTNSFDFFDGTAKTFNLANGETIAVGFLDANADGSGSGGASVIPYFAGAAADVYYTGGPDLGDSANVSEGGAPTPSASNDFTGTLAARDYNFNIDLSTAVLSVDDFIINSSSLELYPNPSSDMISVKAISAPIDKLQFDIYDSRGRIMLSKNLVFGSEVQINISSLANGVYFLKVKGTGISKRIVKK